MTRFTSVVDCLERSARRAPQAIAFVQGSTQISYGELWTGVGNFAGFLQQRGLQPGDRVAVLMENCPQYAVAYYGAMAAGGTAVGLNFSARARELTAWLTHCGSRWLVADRRHPDFDLVAGLPDLTVVAIDDAGPAAVHGWSEAIARFDHHPVPLGHESPAAIIYTSGTTGRPKGVCLTHGNLAANTAAIIRYLDLSCSDRVLNVLPFFYSYGASVLHTHLVVGATIILENHFVYPQRILDRIRAEHVTGFPGVPATFALLLQSTDLSAARGLRYMTQAGGAMPVVNVERLRRQLPDVDLFVMYGQTEATARLTYLPPSRLADKLGSVGVPLDGVEIQVHGENGSRVAPAEVGEVCVRGANVMSGYFNDPEATARVLRDGWLHTGDLGYLDSDGYLYLQGRRSDMIKSGAHRISPLDIEEVITAMPGVAEVAVVGVADAVLGEAVKAVVVLRPDATSIDAMAVQRHCIQHLPRYKVPKVVEFAAQLPRTSSGKIKRYELIGLAS